MIKIYFNKKTVILTSNEKNISTDDNHVVNYIENSNLFSCIDLFLSDNKYEKLYLIHNEINLVFNKIITKYTLIEAAGGIVTNSDYEILFIYRQNKWDLPKGKIDKGESKEDAALREVKEECGINNLEIIKELSPTFHTYTLNGKKIIKKTWWFEMKNSKKEKLIPQKEEGIIIAKWTSPEFVNNILKNTHLSIKNLITNYIKNSY